MLGCGSNFRICTDLRAVLFFFLTLLILPEFVSAQAAGEAVINNRFANLRAGPGTQYTKIGVAAQGDRFPVMEIRPEWVEIDFRGRPAWVSRQLVSIEDKAPSVLEVNAVAREVEKLNQRIDSIMVKLERANRVLEARIDEEQAKQMERERRKKIVSRENFHDLVSPAWIFVPGGPRIAAGQRYKGLALAGLTTGFAAAGVEMYGRFRDYQKDYRALDQSAPAEEFERLYKLGQDRRRLSRTFFMAAAGMFALNVADYFFLLPRALPDLQVQTVPEGRQRINLSLNHKF